MCPVAITALEYQKVIPSFFEKSQGNDTSGVDYRSVGLHTNTFREDDIDNTPVNESEVM